MSIFFFYYVQEPEIDNHHTFNSNFFPHPYSLHTSNYCNSTQTVSYCPNKLVTCTTSSLTENEISTDLCKNLVNDLNQLDFYTKYESMEQIDQELVHFGCLMQSLAVRCKQLVQTKLRSKLNIDGQTYQNKNSIIMNNCQSSINFQTAISTVLTKPTVINSCQINDSIKQNLSSQQCRHHHSQPYQPQHHLSVPIRLPKMGTKMEMTQPNLIDSSDPVVNIYQQPQTNHNQDQFDENSK